MECSTCHTDLNEASGRCEVCLVLGNGLPSEEATTEAATSNKAGRRGAIAGVFLVASIAAVILWAGFVTYYLYEQVSAEAFGFWIGTLFIPFLVSYLVAGVKKRRNPVRFSICLLAIGIGLPSLSLPSKRPKLSTAEMIREFSGTQPLDPGLSENEKVEATVTKAYFDDLRQFSQSYSERDAALAPALAKLYFAESFTSRKSLESVLAVLRQKLALEQETVQKMDDAPVSIRVRLDKTSLSESDKEDFIKGFQNSLFESETYRARKELMKPETAWVGATTDLYRFSLDHLAELSVTGGKIAIASGATRAQFNAKLTAAKQLAAEYRAEARRFNSVREAGLKRAGVTASDLSLKK